MFKGVKFSCHFTLGEIQERWYALMYDPVISKLAMEASRNLSQEVVHKVAKATVFSREDALASCGLKSTSANVDTIHFERLLASQPTVFHPRRGARALLTHWQYMRQYSLLPDQTVAVQCSLSRGQRPGSTSSTSMTARTRWWTVSCWTSRTLSSTPR